MLPLRPLPVLSYPLFSTVFKLVYFLWIAVRLPLWLFSYALIPSSRAQPNWTLHQALLVRLAREVIHMRSVTRTSPGSSVKSHVNGMTIIEPSASFLYREVLDVERPPASIRGTWYPRPLTQPPALPASSRIMLHMHGGAFIMGSSRQDYLGFLCSTMVNYSGFTAVFAPEYRLSSGPCPPTFPAALQDMLTSYLYLVNTAGTPPDKLTVSGDSAGANLIIAFLRYLSRHADSMGVPLPASAILVSPWVAPNRLTDSNYSSEANPQFKSDYLPHSHLHWGANAYIGDNSPSNPYISPIGYPFSTPVRILVTVGTAELFKDDIVQWAHEMQQVEGNDVRLNYEEGAPHDTLLVGSMLGWKESAESVAAVIGAFVQEKYVV
ncbi:hypothetical protein NUW58_g615 [Xylaria curta]|uniref:Uncharacterized protein n=1 Tax=Xylaria curta TaxID=42375 RepID=A0ACC1PPJ1_9PEZI|nr:hypothetical protein NUW58_g615 [Xylaria curta]